MDAAHEAMILVLKSIRNQADSVLKKIENACAIIEQRSLAWRCVACGYTKHFTRPVSIEVAAPCPKCNGDRFNCL
jgi:Zn finger protein HypA/HybF involved in hydrogenase expression